MPKKKLGVSPIVPRVALLGCTFVPFLTANLASTTPYFAGGAFDLLFNFLDNATWTFGGFVGGAGGGSVWKLPHHSYANFQFMVNVGLRFTYAYTRALNGSYKWNKNIKWQKIANGLEVGVRIPTIRGYKTYRDFVVFVNYTWGICWELLRNCHK